MALSPASDMTIRRIRPDELQAAHAFVQSVVNETYAFVWGENVPAISETDWSPSWVADNGAGLIALMLTSADWVEDLWIAKPHRRLGLGTKLLALGEEEIRARGFAAAKLRVVAGNTAAESFYRRHGWNALRQYPHERLPIEMIDFEKRLS
jgi:GNAT superfamily N-acetyltransferase